jgi:TatD DNase family protein
MIDVHCHLEQKDYDKDRDEVIDKCKKELKAVITCCCHPEDFDLTLNLLKEYNNFVFATFSIHPEFIKEISEKEIEKFFERIEENKDFIVGIGETGLDYIIEEENFREKQKELFKKFIELAKDLKKPLVIHARKAFPDTIEILEKNGAKNVLMHFFTQKELLPKIIKNNWSISVNTTLLKSKKIKKIVRDLPIEKIMTETDSPWLGLRGKRNDPLSVKIVAKEIAKIKKISFDEISKITDENAKKFFNLTI